jgi:hypothetical protein
MGYVVMVDDNLHFMDEGSRSRVGEFAEAEVAIGHCRRIVDDYLVSAHEPGMSAGALWDSFTMFGEDPFICSVDAPFVSWALLKPAAA